MSIEPVDIAMYSWLAYLFYGMWRGIGSLNPDAMSMEARTGWFFVNLILSCALAAILYWSVCNWNSPGGIEGETIRKEGAMLGVLLFALCTAVWRAWRCLRVIAALPEEIDFFRKHGFYL